MSTFSMANRQNTCFRRLTTLNVLICGLLIIPCVNALSNIGVFSYTILDQTTTLPNGWRKGGRADPNSRLSFNLVLDSPSSESFNNHVLEVSTPGSRHYGKHLTREDVNDYLRIPGLMRDNIVHWLSWYHVDFHQQGQVLNINSTVAQAEWMLDTTFWYFWSNGRQVVRTMQYSVPAEIRPYIQTIQPTTYLGRLKPLTSHILPQGKVVAPVSVSKLTSQSCSTTITPTCLQDLYQLGNASSIPRVPGNTLGISGYLEQWVSYDDLSRFASSFAPWISGYNLTIAGIDGGLNEQHNLTQDSQEANLDIQYAASLASSSDLVFFSTAGTGPLDPDLDQPSVNASTNEPYLTQLTWLNSLPNERLPTVLSTSYGEDEQSVPRDYAIAVCKLFGQLGARGVSIIFSSGDEGVGSSCVSNDGKNTTTFNPGFPASCPFVTSVGGTTGIKPEVGTAFSGGGFSNVFQRPSYQELDVDGYLNRIGNTFEGLFQPAGRAIPDVSAQSDNFAFFDKGRSARIGGTSAAAPTFAAIVSKLNAIRLSKGLPSLGFLNPFLYGCGRQGFTDIVDGGSTGCTGYSMYSSAEGAYVPHASWNATRGWDPATGLGTPIFPKLVQAMFEGWNLSGYNSRAR